MIPGPDQVIACPHCRSIARYRTLISGNDLGEELWTDLCRIAPMYPEPPAFIRCVACRGFYWQHQALLIGTIPGEYDQDERRAAPALDPSRSRSPYVREPDIGDFEEALRTVLPEEPFFHQLLRLLALHRRNDPFRSGRHLDDHTPDPPGVALLNPHWQRSNLNALLQTTCGTSPRSVLLRGDILRRLGHFLQAAAVFAELPASGFTLVRARLIALCDRRIAAVRRIR